MPQFRCVVPTIGIVFVIFTVIWMSCSVEVIAVFMCVCCWWCGRILHSLCLRLTLFLILNGMSHTYFCYCAWVGIVVTYMSVVAALDAHMFLLCLLSQTCRNWWICQAQIQKPIWMHMNAEQVKDIASLVCEESNIACLASSLKMSSGSDGKKNGSNIKFKTFLCSVLAKAIVGLLLF